MLNQPYPLSDVTPRSITGLFLSGVFVAVFLLVFQPFGIMQWHTPHKILKIIGYGLITFLVLLINFYGIKKNWRSVFNEQTWTVWKEIVWVLFILTTITTANYFYNIFILHTASFVWHDWLTAVLTTFSVGIFPVAAFTFLHYTFRLREYTRPVSLTHPEVRPDRIELLAENGKDRLLLNSDQLLYIESCDNYCTVYYLKNGHYSKELIRSSLTRLEGQVAQPGIVRCHRSYVVNLTKVERVSGNAQGYKLHLTQPDVTVPVARKYAPSVLAFLQRA